MKRFMWMLYPLALFLALALFPHHAYSSDDTPPALDKLKGAELEREFKAVQYLLGDDAKAKLDKAQDDGAQQKALHELYEELDSEKSEDALPFRKLFYKRLNLAQERYSTPTKEGWKRDRGRVLIQYGEPDDIDQSPHLEVWHYYGMEGGVVFVFSDKEGLGIWDLVHSTKQGEVYDPSWNKMIR